MRKRNFSEKFFVQKICLHLVRSIKHKSQTITKLIICQYNCPKIVFLLHQVRSTDRMPAAASTSSPSYAKSSSVETNYKENSLNGSEKSSPVQSKDSNMQPNLSTSAYSSRKSSEVLCIIAVVKLFAEAPHYDYTFLIQIYAFSDEW